MSMRLLLFFALIFILFIHPLGGDGDFFHHMNTGKYVLTHFTLPHQDEFTFTALGKDWVGFAWGAGSIFYLIYTYFGAVGISLFVAMMGMLTLGLLYFFLRGLKVPTSTALLMSSFAAPIVAARWPNRPEIFTYPFLLCLLLVDQLKEKYPRLVILFPLITFVWANTYGASVLSGLIIIAALLIKQFIVDGYKFLPAAKLFFIFAPLSIVAAFTNGYGLKTIFYINYIREISKNQVEWYGIVQTLTQTTYQYVVVFQYYVLLYLLFLSGFLLLLALNYKNLKTYLGNKQYLFLLIISMSIFIPFAAFRQTALAVFLSIPIMAILFMHLSLKQQFLLKIYIVIATLFSTLIIIWVRPLGIMPDTAAFPPGLIQFIRSNNLSGRILASQQLGAYLTFNLYPSVLVYSDTRDDLFVGSQILMDYYQTIASHKSLLPLADNYKVDIVVGDLLEGPSYKVFFTSGNWAPVYIHGHYFIAVPLKTAREKKMPILDAIDPFSPTQSKPNQEQNALLQYEKSQLSSAPDDQIRLSYPLLALGEIDKGIDIISKIKVSPIPETIVFAMEKDYLLSQAYLANKDCKNTKKYLDRTNQGIISTVFLNPKKQLPSPVDKGYAFYYLLCEKNPAQAQKFLNSYLKQSWVNDAERKAVQNQFDP